jgi:hypothetical protein
MHRSRAECPNLGAAQIRDWSSQWPRAGQLVERKDDFEYAGCKSDGMGAI